MVRGFGRGWGWGVAFTVCSLFGSECRPVDGEQGGVGEGRGGRGRSAVFSRRSFLCVGLMAPSGGRNPQSNLLSPQNTLCYKTHTPSGSDSALNFLPVTPAAGQREKATFQQGPGDRSLLRSRANNHARWNKTEVV